MAALDLVPNEIQDHYEVREWRNALAILAAAHPDEWREIIEVLSKFRLLFELRAIDVGVIVTRSDELQEIFADLGRGPSFGASTTDMSKLLPRLDGGGGGGCPVAVFGIRRGAYVED